MCWVAVAWPSFFSRAKGGNLSAGGHCVVHPSLRARVQLSQPLKTKKGHLAATLFCFWWRRREFESSLSLDRPPLRSGHPSLRARVQTSQPLKTKKGRVVCAAITSSANMNTVLGLRGRFRPSMTSATDQRPVGHPFLFLVEAAGV